MEITSEIIGSMKSTDVKNLIKDNIINIIENKESVKEILKNDKRSSVREICSYIEKKDLEIKKEFERSKALYDFDRKFGKVLAGIDEVGRGPLAGPIVAAAVILDLHDDDSMILELNDSKQLSKKKRKELSDRIKEKAIAYCIAEHSNKDIDNLGISFCNNDVFKKAALGLKVRPEFLLTDGYPVKGIDIHGRSVIKGDTKSASIAAASIIAKVYRDELMEKMAEIYPGFGFESNVGYGSSGHIEALKQKGATPIHRMSFLHNII